VEAADVAENQLKAAYLVHLSEFTTWPEAKMQLPTFSICLSKKSFLGDPLDEIRGRLVKDKPLEIVYDAPADKLNTCHILYIEETGDKKILQQSIQKSDSILSVSSEAGFAKSGGVIEFYTDNDKKLKMRINLKAMRQSNLMINSSLLRLMDVIP
jgi:hypothetical protein